MPKKAKIINGKELSNQLISSLIPKIRLITEKIGRPPALGVILVGENNASEVYVRNKITQTKKAGMISVEHRLSSETKEKTLLDLINNLNEIVIDINTKLEIWRIFK